MVVFAECALTGYSDVGVSAALSSGRVLKAIKLIESTCKALSTAAVFGAALQTKNGGVENVAIVINEEGNIVNIQSKLQLVPTDSFAQPGKHLFIFSLFGVICSSIICHDVRHPELVRLPVLRGARVIFYLSFETWHDDGPVPRVESELNAYRAQVQARAVENRVWVIHGNVAGTGDPVTMGEGSHGSGRVVGPDGIVRCENSTEMKKGEDGGIVDFVACEVDVNFATALYAKESVGDAFFMAEWWREGAKKYVHEYSDGVDDFDLDSLGFQHCRNDA